MELLVGEHAWDSYFHFGSTNAITKSGGLLTAKAIHTNVVMIIAGDGQLSSAIKDEWVSPGYGARVKSKTVKYSGLLNSSLSLTVLISPYKQLQEPLEEIERRALSRWQSLIHKK